MTLKRFYTRIKNRYYEARQTALTWQEIKRDILPCFKSRGWMVFIARRVKGVEEDQFTVRNYRRGLNPHNCYRILEIAFQDLTEPDTRHQITKDGRERVVSVTLEVEDE